MFYNLFFFSFLHTYNVKVYQKAANFQMCSQSTKCMYFNHVLYVYCLYIYLNKPLQFSKYRYHLAEVVDTSITYNYNYFEPNSLL